MKRILFSIALFSSFIVSAQTVIVDEKYTEISKPVDFKYLPNSKKFVLFKCNNAKTSLASLATDAYLYDINGNKSVLFENDKLVNCSFSLSENTFKGNDGTKLTMNPNFKYFQNNTLIQTINKDDIIGNLNYFGIYDINNSIYYQKGRLPFSPFCASFNDTYELGFTNQKNKNNINFEKDDIYLEIFNIKSKEKNRVKLETTKLDLLKGKLLIESAEEVTFTCKLKGNDNFDFVTKSLSKDQNETTIYKTTYDIQGKKIKDVVLKLKLKDSFFVLSSCGVGYVDLFNFDVQAVNNYYEDPKNDDIYVYGIYTSKKSKIFKWFDPVGFYIFKFDKDGNKIWESINPINDSYFKDLNYSQSFNIDLIEYNDKLVFTNSANEATEFSNYALVDKSSGNVLKTNRVSYNRNTGFEKTNAFISNTNESKELLRKVFAPLSFVAIDLDPKLLAYLKNIPQKSDRIYFQTIFSNEGIWLVETDNEKYYKVLLFKE